MLTKSPPGFGLIELLIALFVFSFAILALLRLQWLALQQSQVSELRATAINQATNLLEQISSNPNANESMLQQWRQQTQHKLPSGQGQIFLGQNDYHIVIYWQQRSMLTSRLNTAKLIWRVEG